MNAFTSPLGTDSILVFRKASLQASLPSLSTSKLASPSPVPILDDSNLFNNQWILKFLLKKIQDSHKKAAASKIFGILLLENKRRPCGALFRNEKIEFVLKGKCKPLFLFYFNKCHHAAHIYISFSSIKNAPIGTFTNKSYL